MSEIVPGKLNKPHVRDEHQIYRAAVNEIADDLGWKRGVLWSHFEWFARMREFEMRIPRPLAEYFALQDVQDCFMKQGAADAS